MTGSLYGDSGGGGGVVCLILLGIFSSSETGFEESRGTEYSGL